jgi:hypothetical protein
MLCRLLLILTVWTGLASAAAAEPVYPPGMRIGLEPPASAKLATDFPGFEDAEHKVKITILDLPDGAYEALEAATLAPNQPGIENLKRETFTFNSGTGVLVTGRGQKDGAPVQKWHLLAKAAAGPVQDLTTLINVEVPDAARAVYTDALVRKTLASVTFRPTPIEEQLGLLPFKVSELAGFRVMQALPTGGVVLTEGPDDDLQKQPFVIVSIGRGGPADAGERGRFARDLLNSSPLRELAVRSAEPMRIAGSPGYEIRATAKNLAGQPISLVQWVRFGGGGFLRVVGGSREDAWDGMFPRFRAVRDGIELK